MTQAETTPMDATPTKAAYEWRVWLSKKEPGKFWVVICAALFAGLAGLVLTANLILGPIGFIVIMLATADFWMPVHCRISDKEASSKVGWSTTAIEWDKVKRVLVSSIGVKLSPLESETRLSPFRGVFLRFDGNKQDVLNAITERWEGELELLD